MSRGLHDPPRQTSSDAWTRSSAPLLQIPRSTHGRIGVEARKIARAGIHCNTTTPAATQRAPCLRCGGRRSASLFEELRRLPLNTETRREPTGGIHNPRSIMHIGSAIGARLTRPGRRTPGPSAKYRVVGPTSGNALAEDRDVSFPRSARERIARDTVAEPRYKTRAPGLPTGVKHFGVCGPTGRDEPVLSGTVIGHKERG